MDGGIRLGKIFGFPLTLDWSVLVILWVFTWSLASTLPTIVPHRPPAMYWLAGAYGACALLASLLAHEVTHAVTARRAGVRVRGIRLWLLGGIARLADEPRTPRDAFVVAASGPVVSLMLAGGFSALAFVLRLCGVSDVVVALAWWLAAANLALALFNLLPAAPLDGGRILRAVLWHRGGDATRAAVAATGAGRVVAALLIAAGLFQFLAGAMIGGVWLVFVGLFLYAAAREEQWWTLARQDLASVTVGDVMTAAPHVAPDWISIDDFIHRFLLGDRHSTYPAVNRRGQITGLITLSRLRRVPSHLRASTVVRDVALPLDRVVLATPSEPLTLLLDRLIDTTDKRALVTQHGELVGIVTASDLTRLIDITRLAASGVAGRRRLLTHRRSAIPVTRAHRTP